MLGQPVEWEIIPEQRRWNVVTPAQPAAPPTAGTTFWPGVNTNTTSVSGYWPETTPEVG